MGINEYPFGVLQAPQSVVSGSSMPISYKRWNTSQASLKLQTAWTEYLTSTALTRFGASDTL